MNRLPHDHMFYIVHAEVMHCWDPHTERGSAQRSWVNQYRAKGLGLIHVFQLNLNLNTIIYESKQKQPYNLWQEFQRRACYTTTVWSGQSNISYNLSVLKNINKIFKSLCVYI